MLARPARAPCSDSRLLYRPSTPPVSSAALCIVLNGWIRPTPLGSCFETPLVDSGYVGGDLGGEREAYDEWGKKSVGLGTASRGGGAGG